MYNDDTSRILEERNQLLSVLRRMHALFDFEEPYEDTGNPDDCSAINSLFKEAYDLIQKLDV